MNKLIDPKSSKRISITGDDTSLEIVERIFKLPRYTVSTKLHGDNKYKEYFLTSNLLSNLDNIDAIRNVGTKLIDEINSICKFVKYEFKSVSLDMIYVDQCGYISFEEKICMRDNFYIIENGKEIDIDEPQILTIVAQIENDNLLKDILITLNRKGWNWVNIYRILDMFKGAKIDIIKKGWITKENYKKITHTANSPAIIGEESRHGYQSGEPPKNPIVLNIAKTLVSSIIWNYINEANPKAK
jgi:hypothetical protein